MDLGPACQVDPNLTYSYSSSEDSLTEPFNISFTQTPPSISAESSLKRKELQKRKSSTNFMQSQYLKHESLLPSPQVMKMYSNRLQSEKMLEPGSCIKRKHFASSRENTMSRSTSSNNSNSSLRSSQSQVPLENLNKMEQILRKATQQSEDLSKMFKYVKKCVLT